MSRPVLDAEVGLDLHDLPRELSAVFESSHEDLAQESFRERNRVAAKEPPGQAFERARGLTDLTRGPDFGLSGVVQRWAEGEEFDAVLSRTSLAPGDLVRVLRMSIQMLRQAYHALPGADPVAKTLREARLRLDRDVVDAKRQLELG